ncbi:MAG: hypothetical protein PHY48_15375 [Candidatus Cloacimonetes bacterium]|nr:hypothetical protein [Candidatus Cloacimonadota bacterium]
MDEVVAVVADEGFSGVELALALVGLAGIVRMGVLASRVVIKAARIIELAERGESV